MKIVKRALLVVALMLASPLIAMEGTSFRVGQGNLVFISSPKEPSLLADAGSTAMPLDAQTKKAIPYEEIIDEVLDTIIERTPTKKMCILVSHPDLDHSKWVIKIAKYLLEEKFKIRMLLGGLLIVTQRILESR